ncbi:MAG: 3,4-dihydroxy 2-butanone 4-phosphate synthase/GTP cyclohydrolase II [Candidatus Promineifilaceae bacterium]|jgi:3,4-dihydroxy 2-butanone 4-phosphate synthase / GTP cyclohydrolase II
MTAADTKATPHETLDEDTLFDSVESVIEAVRQGEIVIVTDDANRENEGDFIMAGECVSETAINFMAQHGRGLICTTATRDRLADLGLSRMRTKGKGDPFNTAFMDSVDAATGISTGISARDRAETIRLIVNDDSVPNDLVSPGHMFPIEALAGGVLVRAGHTEASVDLAVQAGYKPVGVICEILKPNGEMARVPELRALADTHGLRMTSVAALIAYRRKRERLIEFLHEVHMPTHVGDFRMHLYRSHADNENHLALVRGDITTDEPVLIRVHSECLTGDVFGSMRCDCGQQLQEAMRMVAREDRGVILYMRQEGRGIGLANKIHAYHLQEQGMDTVEANQHLGFDADLREYGVGAQIITDLGIKSMRLITNNPRKIIGLEAHGLEIAERVSLVLPPTEHNADYLKAKQEKLGHLLW